MVELGMQINKTEIVVAHMENGKTCDQKKAAKSQWLMFHQHL